MSAQTHRTNSDEIDDEQIIREIHAIAPPHTPPSRTRSYESSSLSIGSEISSENFTSMSREFNALVLAGSASTMNNSEIDNHNLSLSMIGEEETNPLAIVPETNPITDHPSDPPLTPAEAGGGGGGSRIGGELMLHAVKKEEVESKISAWENAKIAKINNRFKREDALIHGWESEQVEKATSWMKKIERKLEEKRARAFEKMQNDIARAKRKTEEKIASAEAKRGTEVSRVVELSNFMRAVGRPPAKRSFF